MNSIPSFFHKYFHFLALLALLLAFGLRLHLTTQLGTQVDEGAIFAAAHLMTGGDRLYTDLFWNHMPGVLYCLSALFSLLGSLPFLYRFLSVSAAVTTTAVLMGVGRGLGQETQHRRWAEAGGLLAGFLFALAPLPIHWSRFGMLENFETLFAVLCMGTAVYGLKTRVRWWWLLAGGLAGAALLVKVSALVLIGAVGLFLLCYWIWKRERFPFLAGLWFLAGLALVLLPMFLVLWRQGNLADFIHMQSGVERLAPWVAINKKVWVVGAWSLKRPLIWLAFLGGVGAVRLKKPAYWLILLWALLEGFAILLPPRVQLEWSGFSHYAIPFIAAASLLAGSGMVGLFSLAENRRKRGWALAAIVILPVLLMLPGWGRDLLFVGRDVVYPEPDYTAETAVGRALSLGTPADKPIQVFGNAVVYYWADRQPASQFYHYPAYLSSSKLADEAAASLSAALQPANSSAIVVSGTYWQRLTEEMKQTLAEEWQRMAVFPYSYQDSMVLFFPRQQKETAVSPPIAAFEHGIQLHQAEADILAPEQLLVRLAWSTTAPIKDDYTVFVHLATPDGFIAAQRDGPPARGAQPTTAWRPGRLIDDWRHIAIPPGLDLGDYNIYVGLYDPETGERLFVDDGEATNVVIPISSVP